MQKRYACTAKLSLRLDATMPSRNFLRADSTSDKAWVSLRGAGIGNCPNALVIGIAPPATGAIDDDEEDDEDDTLGKPLDQAWVERAGVVLLVGMLGFL